MLRPSLSFRFSAWTCWGLPLRNIWAKTLAGLVWAGIITPPLVYDWLCGLTVPSVTEGNRVT